jgi:pimeloyl-ACP methyl ester carboxylesterase
MTRAAMLAALIVGIAMQAAAAEPFYREDVRIPMQAAGPRADNDVCDEDALVRAFATLGRTSRIPTLWIYAQNDKFFGPELVRRRADAIHRCRAVRR